MEADEESAAEAGDDLLLVDAASIAVVGNSCRDSCASDGGDVAAVTAGGKFPDAMAAAAARAEGGDGDGPNDGGRGRSCAANIAAAAAAAWCCCRRAAAAAWAGVGGAIGEAAAAGGGTIIGEN
jgi:hypothetical protein